jgi:hypothetical protein
MEEFLNKALGMEKVALRSLRILAPNPTAANMISNSCSGSKYLIALYSSCLAKALTCAVIPLCKAACSNEALQALSYMGSSFKHMDTINGVSIPILLYQDESN